MKTYYRGEVNLVQDIKDLNYERVIAASGCYSYSTPVFKEYEKDYNYGEEKYLTNFFDTISRSDFKYDITDEGAIGIFNHIFSKENSRYLVPANITPKLEIVYEIITDKTGTMYAKELYTGCLFPLTFNWIKHI